MMIKIYYDFHETKKRMNMYLYVIGLLLVGFVVYFLLKDKIFDSASSPPDVEKFQTGGPR